MSVPSRPSPVGQPDSRGRLLERLVDLPAVRPEGRVKIGSALAAFEAGNLPVSVLGNSAGLRPGEWVAAIGSPFGFERSLAVGVVSAAERIVPGDEFYTPFIQTDLPLDPGNSAGPLFDAAGSVVGINTEVVVGENGNAGISFAIPIATTLLARLATQRQCAEGWRAPKRLRRFSSP